MSDSKIEWTEKTWNPVTGCTPVSEGCANCYAKRMANRLRGRCGYPEDDPFSVTFHKNRLDEPFRGKPSRYFVCSMADLFHEHVPIQTILTVFDHAEQAALKFGHIFIFLTKRPKRMRQAVEKWLELGRPIVGSSAENNPFPFWLGVTAENQARADERIPILLQIPAAVRFVSVEPMLGPVDLRPYLPAEYWCFCGYVGDETGTDYCTSCEKEFGYDDDGGNTCVHCGHGEYDSACPECGDVESFGLWDTGPLDLRPPRLDWVICGGETGPKARPMHPDWVRSLRDQCQAASVPFFFKKWGEWLSVYERDAEDPDWRRCDNVMRATPRGRWLNLAGGHGFHGERVVRIDRIGGKCRGVDGQLWEQFPEASR